MTEFVAVEGKELNRAMKIASAVIERRNTIPILNCVKIALSQKGMTIAATDLDIDLSIDVDIYDGDGDWSMCIPATTLAQIAAVAGVEIVKIERSTRTVPGYVYSNGKTNPAYEQDQAHITVGDEATYDLDALPASDWPSMSRTRGDSIERFTNGLFAESVRKVAWAISTEETRYYLNGVNWQADEKGQRFVATDGHRLAACRYTTETSGAWSRIIPRKTVAFIDRFFAGRDVEIFATDSEVVIDIDTAGMKVRTKLIDGTFPDVDRVFPKEKEHEFIIKPDELLTAVKKATAIGGELRRAVRFFESEGKLQIERKSPDFGSATVKTSTDWPAGASAFGLNGKYVTDVFSRCVGTVTLEMSGAGAPFLVKDEDATMTRVMMPMRV